jgi:hypothetical protein
MRASPLFRVAAEGGAVSARDDVGKAATQLLAGGVRESLAWGREKSPRLAG